MVPFFLSYNALPSLGWYIIFLSSCDAWMTSLALPWCWHASFICLYRSFVAWIPQFYPSYVSGIVFTTSNITIFFCSHHHRPLWVLSLCNFSFVQSFSHFHWAQEPTTLAALFSMVVLEYVLLRIFSACLLSLVIFPLKSSILLNSIKQLGEDSLFGTSNSQKITGYTPVVILSKGLSLFLPLFHT